MTYRLSRYHAQGLTHCVISILLPLQQWRSSSIYSIFLSHGIRISHVVFLDLGNVGIEISTLHWTEAKILRYFKSTAAYGGHLWFTILFTSHSNIVLSLLTQVWTYSLIPRHCGFSAYNFVAVLYTRKLRYEHCPFSGRPLGFIISGYID